MTSTSASAFGGSPQPEDTPQTSNCMSPPQRQPTEIDYAALSALGQQTFDQDFLLEAHFGPLPVPEGNSDLKYFQGPSGTQGEEPLSAATLTSSDNPLSRRSTGLATLSSHLMSPVLTDAASPESGNEGMDSPLTSKFIGREDMLYTRHTPAPTGSSVNASPNLSGGQAQFSTPHVRVERYTRGDSPARVEETPPHSGSKRNRNRGSSSHLAPEVDSSEDGEYIAEHEDRTARFNPQERAGLTPLQRNDQTVMSVNELEERRVLAVKNANITKWLAVSDVIGEPGPLGPRTSRRRAKSTSGSRELQADAFGISRGLRAEQEKQLPGPGALIDEQSTFGEDMESDYHTDESVAPAEESENRSKFDEDEYHDSELNEHRPQDAFPWIDPIYFPSQEGTQGQPPTSNAAMMRFALRAKDLETASRAATWGTRRMSDSDLQQVFGSGGLFSRLSISKDKDEWRQLKEFKETVEQAAARLLPKRNNSTARRKQSEPSRPASRDTMDMEAPRKESLHKRKESLQSLHERKESITAAVKRKVSTKRPKSPRLNTSTSGLIAAATQVATVVASGPGPGSPPNQSPTNSFSWTNLKTTTREAFSRNSSHDASDTAVLRSQQAASGRPNVSSPPKEKQPPTFHTHPTLEEEDGESEDEKGVSMDFTPRQDRIIPTFDGFKMNVRDVNPRLPVYLVERLGQEQLRRYKKLVEFKVRHAQATQLGNCDSGARCVEKGGQPVYFPSKTSSKEPTLSHTGFSEAGTGEMDEDDEAVADGAVTAAQFPLGVPMPPVKRLPAEFECPLCFQVKKFHKPSDWSKHVHEDLQPFTCTFPTCPDPKSFKRKADWVRHENERHRQLEWWKCSEEGCPHKCFRRDNFVQHLVREHKMPEPKAKTVKGPNKPAVRGPAKSKVRAGKGSGQDPAPEDKVLNMVDTCRYETTSSAMDEPCRFCGNVCNSFKKLTVHLARHMEQISMPVLDLVKQKDVTPDTIISPIDIKLPQINISPSTQTRFRDSVSVSPYDHPVDMTNGGHTLPGSFNPMQSGPVFRHAGYGNQISWTNPNGQGPQIQAQPPGVYDSSMAGSWIPSDNVYHDNGASQYSNLSTQEGYMQPNPVSGPDMYNTMTGHAPQGTYHDGQGFQVDMDQSSHMSGSPYMGHEHMSQQSQGGLSIQNDTTFTQPPNDGSIYHGAQTQHQQQQQQQQQAPYYSTY